MKKFWNRKKYWQKGLVVGLILETLSFVFYFVGMIFSYDGLCGGILPALEGQAECTFFEHLSIEFGWVSILISEFGYMFWMVLILFLIFTIFIGYVFGRVVNKKSTPESAEPTHF